MPTLLVAAWSDPLLLVPRILGTLFFALGLGHVYQWRKSGDKQLPGRVVAPLVLGGMLLLLSVIVGLGLDGQQN